MKNSLILFIFALLLNHAGAAVVDTAVIYSASMKKEIKCVIIKPDSYKQGQRRFPAVYLLHGYSDHYDTWVKTVPAIKSCADQMQMIIVCPDGGFSSWYFDSPIDPGYRYETHISREVVTYIDTRYRTIPDRGHRAIAGLSMGGHGALFLALKHPDVFGAAGSMSGGVDMKPFPQEWDIAKRIGDFASHKENWEKMSVAGMVGRFQAASLAIMIDCGTDDFFHEVNLQLHKKLLELKIPHDYVERPGAHNWDYWRNAVEYHRLFIEKYFSGRVH